MILAIHGQLDCTYRDIENNKHHTVLFPIYILINNCIINYEFKVLFLQKFSMDANHCVLGGYYEPTYDETTLDTHISF